MTTNDYIPRHRSTTTSQDDYRNLDYVPRHRAGTFTHWTQDYIYRLFRRGLHDLRGI